MAAYRGLNASKNSSFIKKLVSRRFSKIVNQFYFHPTFKDTNEKNKIETSFRVFYKFISEAEECELEKEVSPVLKRLRYEADHWDAAILGYRETEKKDWNRDNTQVLQRIKQIAFANGAVMPLVHVLDLKAEGVIKPHVDSVKFCGNTIAGLSLLSDAVMRLANEKHPELVVDIFLPRRSLYIMSGASRYEYTHAVLGGDESVFEESTIQKTRRISIICRNDPCDV